MQFDLSSLFTGELVDSFCYVPAVAHNFQHTCGEARTVALYTAKKALSGQAASFSAVTIAVAVPEYTNNLQYDSSRALGCHQENVALREFLPLKYFHPTFASQGVTQEVYNQGPDKSILDSARDPCLKACATGGHKYGALMYDSSGDGVSARCGCSNVVGPEVTTYGIESMDCYLDQVPSCKGWWYWGHSQKCDEQTYCNGADTSKTTCRYKPTEQNCLSVCRALYAKSTVLVWKTPIYEEFGVANGGSLGQNCQIRTRILCHHTPMSMTCAPPIMPCANKVGLS